MITNVEDVLIERVRQLEPDQQQRVLDFVERLAGQERPSASIWERIQERAKNVPPDAWDEVPRDGSVNVDHYLYGAPRK